MSSVFLVGPACITENLTLSEVLGPPFLFAEILYNVHDDFKFVQHTGHIYLETNLFKNYSELNSLLSLQQTIIIAVSYLSVQVVSATV